MYPFLLFLGCAIATLLLILCYYFINDEPKQ